jgi:hypothetical protein
MTFGFRTIYHSAASLARFVRALCSPENIVAPGHVIAARVARCEGCRWFIESSRQCRLCTCFIDVKTLLAAESCPEHHWRKSGRLSSGL